MKWVIALVASLLATGAAQDCGGGYTLVGYACYLIPDKADTWENAKTFCQNSAPPSKTASLAHVIDCEQLQDLWNYIKTNHPIVDYWIGGTDKNGPDGVFRWESTGELVDMEVPFWFPGQPDGSAAETALSLSKTGYFADEPENLLQKFICQLL